MGGITLKSEIKPAKHENTRLDQYKDIQESRFNYVLDRMMKLDCEELREKVVYVYGMGKHPKSTYKGLKSKSGIDVIFYKSTLPKFFRPFSLIVASYSGIVKVNDLSVLKEVFELLINMSMAGIYVYDKRFEDEFTSKIRNTVSPFAVDEIVKEDHGYFIYTVDADNVESETGIVEIVSIGIDCPKKLSSIITLS